MACTCLDGDHFIFEKVLGVAGVKGFGGGFGNATLQAFGEGRPRPSCRRRCNESLKLEAALEPARHAQEGGDHALRARCRRRSRARTPEIRPFLGTSRLAMPIDHYGADGRLPRPRAPRRAARGRPTSGIPVYNVAMPLMAKTTPDQRFALVEV